MAVNEQKTFGSRRIISGSHAVLLYRSHIITTIVSFVRGIVHSMALKMKDYFNADTARKPGTQLGIDGAEYAAWVAPRVEG